jgi:hypothetical protein
MLADDQRVRAVAWSWRHSALIPARFFPKHAGDLEWIDAGRLPPRSLVAGAVDRR